MMTLTIAESADELPDWLPADVRQEWLDWFADGYSYGSVLFMKCGDKIVAKTDGGAPEDKSFDRDLAWIPGALRLAYQQGKLDASEEKRT